MVKLQISDGSVLDLAYDPSQLRDETGKWTAGGAIIAKLQGAGVKLTPSKQEKIKAINDGSDKGTVYVPLAFKPSEVEAIQKVYPDRQIKKINALKVMKAKAATGDDLEDLEIELPKKDKITTAEIAKTQSDIKATVQKGGQVVMPHPEKQASDVSMQKVVEWHANLSPEERKSVGKWTGSFTSCAAIRKSQSKGAGSPTARAFESALSKGVPYEGTVYRGLNLDSSTLAKFEANLMKVGGPGAVIESLSCACSTSNPATATGFGHDVVWKIRNKTGVNLAAVSKYSTESEVTLRKGAKYRVVSVAKNVKAVVGNVGKTNIGLFIELEEIGGNVTGTQFRLSQLPLLLSQEEDDSDDDRARRFVDGEDWEDYWVIHPPEDDVNGDVEDAGELELSDGSTLRLAYDYNMPRDPDGKGRFARGLKATGDEGTQPGAYLTDKQQGRLDAVTNGGNFPFPRVSREDLPPVTNSLWRKGGWTVEDVPVKSLVATQRDVDVEQIKVFLDDGVRTSATREEPVKVLRHGGKNYLWDGHHRTCAAWIKGEESVKARVVER